MFTRVTILCCDLMFLHFFFHCIHPSFSFWSREVLILMRIFWVDDKTVITWKLMQYGYIFLVLTFFYIFSRLKARKNMTKKVRTRKIYLILHSFPCDNYYLLPEQKGIIENTIVTSILWNQCIEICLKHWRHNFSTRVLLGDNARSIIKWPLSCLVLIKILKNEWLR